MLVWLMRAIHTFYEQQPTSNLYVIETFIRALATNHTSISRRRINHILIDGILSVILINTVMTRIGRHMHPVHAALLLLMLLQFIAEWWIRFAHLHIQLFLLLVLIRVIVVGGYIRCACTATVAIVTETNAKLRITQQFQSIFANRSECRLRWHRYDICVERIAAETILGDIDFLLWIEIRFRVDEAIGLRMI